jgi:16S rRNA processing protein RimM
MPKIERRTPKYLTLGKISRPHGVRGEVRMRIITDYPEQLHDLKTVYIGMSPDDKDIYPIDLQKVRFHQDYALLTFKGITNRDQVDKFRKKAVMIDIDNAIQLEDGEYYLFQLIGLKVVVDEQEIGFVKEVIETGANDVYVVKGDQYGEILVPAHEETIIKIDFDTETITMSLPEGLLPSQES